MISSQRSPPPEGLFEFYFMVYRARLLGRRRDYCRHYETAIRAFYRFRKRRGDDLCPIAEIFEADLRRFRRWLMSRGISNQTARDYRKYVRSVLRAAAPDRFPRRSRKRIVPVVPGSLREFFEQTYRPLRLLGGSDGSLCGYRSTLNLFEKFLGHPATIADLTDEGVAKFMAELLGAGRRVATVNKHRRQLLAIWRFARRRKLLEREPLVEKLNGPKRLPDAWTDEELIRIVETASASRGNVAPGIAAGPFWTALILTLLRTGLRITALMRAKTSDLDITRSLLRIPAENQKQRADQAFILDAPLMELLASLRGSDDAALFPWPHDKSGHGWHTLTSGYRSILIRAGVAQTSRDLFHKLRRTAATRLCNALGEQAASQYLGHSAIGVTRAYLDSTQITLTRFADAMVLPEFHLAFSQREPRQPARRAAVTTARPELGLRRLDDPAFVAAVAEEVAKILLARDVN